MAWPTTRVSPDPWCGSSFDSTLLGRFYIKGVGHGYDLSRTNPEKSYEILRKLDYFQLLPEDVLRKLAHSGKSALKRLIYTWRGVEDALLHSTPSLVNKPVSTLHRKLWRWCICTTIHSYEEFVKSWKTLKLHVQHLAARSDQLGGNPPARCVPASTGRGLGPLWYHTLPWLRQVSVANMRKVQPSKKTLTSVGHFCQHRQLPPPPLTEKRFLREVRSWREDLTEKKQVEPDEMKGLMGGVTGICDFILEHKLANPSPHISLTSSGCFQSTRQEGGRSNDFMSRYLDRYVRTAATQDFEGRTIFGAPYVMRKGIPLMYTMCRSEPLDTEIKTFLNSAFRDEEADGTATGAMVGQETSYIEEPMFGLDEELPLQMFQLAIDLCCERKYIAGTPYFSTAFVGDTSNPVVMARAHPVCEAGNKVRWVTMEESFVTVALQPLGHWLAGVIGRHPILYSAFTRTYKGWDMCVSLMRMDRKYPTHYGIGTYDLQGASNNLNIEVCRMVTAEVINRFSGDDVYTRYTLFTLLNLALAPRRIFVFEREGGMNQENDACLSFLTKNGLLMGNPVTKEILCLVSACIIVTCSRLLREPVFSLVAGDDVGLVCSRRFFKEIIRRNKACGNKIQTSKTMFSRVCAFFCEEVIDFRPEFIGRGLAPWQVPYEENLHVDVIKLRLLSPFEGVQSTQQSATYKNPAIGKAGALKRVYDWFPDQKIKWISERRFTHWMADYINNDPLVYLPRNLGGHDIPYLGDRKSLLKRMIKEVPREYIALLMKVKNQDEYHGLIDYLFRRMSTGNSVRGLYDPLLYQMVGQFAFLAGVLCLCETRTWESFQQELQETKTYPVSNRDVVRYIKRQGWLGHNDIADQIDRLTGIRLSFVVAAGTLPLEEYLLSSRSRLPTPTDVLKDFLSVETIVHARRSGFLPERELRLSFEDEAKFKAWILSEEPLEVRNRRSQIYIPSGFVKDSLNGMRIPLPYRKPNRPVRGSVVDTYRDATQVGFITEVVSLNRLRS